MSEISENIKFIRWYQKQPRLDQAVKLLVALPDALQTIVSDAMLSRLQREYSSSQQEQAFRSLGLEKITGLNKSKNRRREYDCNPGLHNAMNHIYVLPGEDQDYMALYALKLLDFVKRYLAHCKTAQVPPSFKELDGLAQVYVQMGVPQAERHMERLVQSWRGKVVSLETRERDIDKMLPITRKKL